MDIEPESPAHTYLRISAQSNRTAEDEMILGSCITSLNAAEMRYYGGYQY